jgi:hypothetical protein
MSAPAIESRNDVGFHNVGGSTEARGIMLRAGRLHRGRPVKVLVGFAMPPRYR